MRYRKLGAGGVPVSEIGFGGWGIGGETAGLTSYGATDDVASLRALEVAFDLGITLFDTSSLYGHGHSETLIGRVFTGNRRDRVVIATKAGYTRYDRPPDYSPPGIRASLQASLERLRTERVEILQLHDASPELLRREPAILDTLRALVGEGLVRNFGASVKSPDDAMAMIREFQMPVIQVNYNMMDTRALTCGLLGLAEERGVGIIARTPLCFGFLSGRIDRGTEFPAGDHRRRWPRRQIDRWIEGAARLREALPPSERQSLHLGALRFCLSHPAVSTVIPGMLSPEEVVANAAASDLGPLPPEVLDRIAAVGAATEFFATEDPDTEQPENCLA